MLKNNLPEVMESVISTTNHRELYIVLSKPRLRFHLISGSKILASAQTKYSCPLLSKNGFCMETINACASIMDITWLYSSFR